MTPPDMIVHGQGYVPAVLSAVANAFWSLALAMDQDDRWDGPHAVPDENDGPDEPATTRYVHCTGRTIEVTSIPGKPYVGVGIDLGSIKLLGRTITSVGKVSMGILTPIGPETPLNPKDLVDHVLNVIDMLGRKAIDSDHKGRRRLDHWCRGACAHLDAVTGRRTAYLVLPGMGRGAVDGDSLSAGDADEETIAHPELARLDAVAPTVVEIRTTDLHVSILPASFVRNTVDADDPVGEIRALVDMHRLLRDAS